MISALLLILVANGTPVIASRLLGRRYAFPIDGNRSTANGHRWLGRSKTFRGILLATTTTALVAAALGLGWKLGAMVGVLAMMGDLISSFIKRRLAMPVSSQAPGLDQIPEALLPLAVCADPLGLQWQQIIVLVGIFWILELLLSRVLYALHIRDHPH